MSAWSDIWPNRTESLEDHPSLRAIFQLWLPIPMVFWFLMWERHPLSPVYLLLYLGRQAVDVHILWTNVIPFFWKDRLTECDQ
jgi:hypothetical protein